MGIKVSALKVANPVMNFRSRDPFFFKYAKTASPKNSAANILVKNIVARKRGVIRTASGMPISEITIAAIIIGISEKVMNPRMRDFRNLFRMIFTTFVV